MPRCNITMLVRNRYLLTVQSLASLGVMTKDATVTILDDRSEEPTRTFVKSWQGVIGAHLIRNHFPLGTGELRNKVINASEEKFGTPEYLYISDNDVFFHRDGWLETLIRYYERVWELGYRVIGAYNHPYHQPIASVGFADGGAVDSVNALATQSMLMRWEVWKKYGPFCVTPIDKVCQSEDVDFTNKIRADGGRLGVISPPLLWSTGITNTFGEKIPGWELVKKQSPPGVIVE